MLHQVMNLNCELRKCSSSGLSKAAHLCFKLLFDPLSQGYNTQK